MEKKEKIIITDTHFGRYNNSINFLKSQMLEFEDLKKYMLKNERDQFDLVHLGDVFESRSTISMYVLDEVKRLLVDLNNILKERNKNNRFIFVAGNHDFYSPDSDRVNSLDTIIHEIIPDAIIVSRDCWIDNDDIYIPWYWMNDPEKFKTLDLNPYSRIFTHCDCKDFDWGKIPVNSFVYSGHIHQYHEYPNVLSSSYSILYNLAAPYSLDYGDSNNFKKGFWILDKFVPELIQNTKSIRYRTFVNDEIFNIDDLEGSIERGDNFRIYISTENKSKLEYITKINELSTDIKYLLTIPISDSITTLDEAMDSLDINNMLSQMIPDRLKDKFEIIKKEVNNE